MTGSEQIIDKLFHEWTAGLSPLAARIHVYEKVRDIPYAVMPELIDEKRYIKILQTGRGSCTPKHFLLAEMYRRLGLLTLFVVYPFRWGERAEVFVDYPVKLRELAQRQAVGYHLACKVEINGRLVTVDATLDLPLAKLEMMPVNKTWDGYSETLLPMTPVGEEMVFHPIEAFRMQARADAISLAFYEELNKTLESIRKG
ncbi:MAG: hypothetical protein PHE50_04120 [Dehalococcoidales bacterium]|nr:hypothetical protein [Dehalococcoidales bacterium]